MAVVTVRQTRNKDGRGSMSIQSVALSVSELNRQGYHVEQWLDDVEINAVDYNEYWNDEEKEAVKSWNIGGCLQKRDLIFNVSFCRANRFKLLFL